MDKGTLILKNIPSEGPGTIADFFSEAGMPYGVVELGEGETPPSLDEYGFLIVMGGPMGVYEMDIYPHLVVCSRLVREAINGKMRVLGVCLGAQIIAHCLGARVYKGPETEIGWRHIELTGEGVRDPVMRSLALHPEVGDFWRKFKVFQWHGDTFDLPVGAVSLARSEVYENQAVRYGDGVYALQFHIEVTKEIVRDWFKGEETTDEGNDRAYAELYGRAMNFYRAFFTGCGEKS